jgi:hypothetical protein
MLMHHELFLVTQSLKNSKYKDDFFGTPLDSLYEELTILRVAEQMA